jgi:hypothetical protein
MALSRCARLPYAAWPPEDRQVFEQVADEVDLFAEEGPISRLSPARRKVVKADYAAFLGFLVDNHPERLSLPPGARVDRPLVAEYVQEFLGDKYSGSTLALFVRHLRVVLMACCPDDDWSWLREIANRLKAGAEPRPKKHMTSDSLLVFCC